MPQILKEDVKQDILKAAKQEFLEKGYKDASLRNIASKANMTVGNLYRYFKNKEDINRQIVGETLDLIEKMLIKMTDNKVSFEQHRINISMDNKELVNALDNLADEMINIYDEHKIEFSILMMKSKLNDEITDWFSNIVKTLINKRYELNNDIKGIDSLARSYAVAIFEGIRHMMLKENIKIEELKKIMKIYFRSYTYMLDTDLRKFVVEK